MEKTERSEHPLEIALEILAQLVDSRLDRYFSTVAESVEKETLLVVDAGQSTFLSENFPSFRNWTPAEQTLLLIGLSAHLQADFWDKIIQSRLPKAGDFPQMGGVRGKNFRGFIPTGETALFVLAGVNMSLRLAVQQLFRSDRPLASKHQLWVEDPSEGEPAMSGKLLLSSEFIDLVVTGQIPRPRFSLRFPAQLIETQMEWNDLVLNAGTMAQIKELETWIRHGSTLLHQWGMHKRLKPGFRALFHGPPGTGKTLTASLLGKYTHREVYRIDLSMVVSKYIGETEKNLANLFARAENKDWILFFDEADALFGKRTNVRDAHDKYANQEVAFLLQRVETYNGLVILASNFKSNIDDAFNRRFNAIIHFPFPKAGERLQLWQQSFPSQVRLAEEIDLQHFSHRYELSGSSIINIVQYCCLQALQQKTTTIQKEDLIIGIRREFEKNGEKTT